MKMKKKKISTEGIFEIKRNKDKALVLCYQDRGIKHILGFEIAAIIEDDNLFKIQEKLLEEMVNKLNN